MIRAWLASLGTVLSVLAFSPVRCPADTSLLPAPTFSAEWGSNGSGTGNFDEPIGIATSPDGALVYVADRQNKRVQITDTTGTLLNSIPFTSISGQSGTTELFPSDVAVCPRDSSLWVLLSGCVIRKFSRTGVFQLERTTTVEFGGILPGFTLAHLAASPEYVFFATNRINNSGDTRSGIIRLTPAGEIDGRFPFATTPTELEQGVYSQAADAANNVYVNLRFRPDPLGTLTPVIRKYSAMGGLLQSWPIPSTSLPAGSIDGMWVDRAGVLWLAETPGHRISVLADSVESSCHFNGANVLPQPVLAPHAIAGDGYGNVYFTDSRDRVVRLDVDLDDDGLSDAWEKYGLLRGVAAGRLPLPDADIRRKDLYVEIDCMDGHALHQLVLDKVTGAFDLSGVPNPSLQSGIALHLEVSDTNVAHAAWDSASAPAQFRAFKQSHFASPSDSSAKALAYRYCVSAHGWNTGPGAVLGMAELSGNDFFLSLGSLTVPPDIDQQGSWQEQAGTLMHELGHTLGLGHGGVDQIDHKPNYYSVMNNTWVIPTEFTRRPNSSIEQWKPVFSTIAAPTLRESLLVEADGIGGLAADLVVPFGPPTWVPSIQRWRYERASGQGAVNWDGEGGPTDTCTTCDINRWGSSEPGILGPPSFGETLVGAKDWNKLVYLPRRSVRWNPHGDFDVTADTPGELTVAEYRAMQASIIDCNENSVSDAIDVETGASRDVDHDGIPDECEPPRLTGVVDSLIVCPGGDLDSLAWTLDVNDVYGIDPYNPELPVYAIVTAATSGVHLWSPSGAPVAGSDTLWAESFDIETGLAQFRAPRGSGCGSLTFDVFAGDTLMASNVTCHIRSQDLDDRADGAVDRFDVEKFFEYFFVLDICADLDGEGGVGANDEPVLKSHFGHSVPRVVLSPNGGEAWVTGQSALVNWRPGRGDSSRVEITAISPPSGLRTLLGHGLADVGTAVVSVPMGLDTCAQSHIEVMHTAGVYDPSLLGCEIGRDSSDAALSVLDGIAPATVHPSVELISSSSITLSWLAPGDDLFEGRAAEYDLRYSLQPITSANWEWAFHVIDEPEPQSAGEYEMVTVSGLPACEWYYFALKTRDEAGNWSGLSDWTIGKTLCSGGPGLSAREVRASEDAGAGVAADPAPVGARQQPLAGSTTSLPASATISGPAEPFTGTSHLAAEQTSDGASVTWRVYWAGGDPDSSANPGRIVWQVIGAGGEWGETASVTRSPRPAVLAVASQPAVTERLLVDADYVPSIFAATVQARDPDGATAYTFSGARRGTWSTSSIDTLNGHAADLLPGDTLVVVYSPTATPDTLAAQWWFAIALPSATLAGGTALRRGEPAAVSEPVALPGSFALHRAAPNPSRTSMALRFDLPRAARVALEIVDVQGRLIRRVVDSSMPAGSHAASWNLRDASSRAVAPGVFFARLRVHDGPTLTEKLTVTR